jgi:hypothetical protein
VNLFVKIRDVIETLYFDFKEKFDEAARSKETPRAYNRCIWMDTEDGQLQLPVPLSCAPLVGKDARGASRTGGRLRSVLHKKSRLPRVCSETARMVENKSSHAEAMEFATAAKGRAFVARTFEGPVESQPSGAAFQSDGSTTQFGWTFLFDYWAVGHGAPPWRLSFSRNLFIQ